MREPLVLVHGIGSDRHVWNAVIPLLEAEREVLAIDLPGFGDAPALDGGAEPEPAVLAGAVERVMDERGWDVAHVAGNSLGGWIALELAKRGRTLSACALSPAGFWRGWEHAYASTSLRVARHAVRRLQGQIDRLVAHPMARRAALAQLMARGDRMPPQEAADAMRSLARAPGWEATLRALERRAFGDAASVRGPVTVAWGEQDRLLLPRQASRAREALPRARHVTLTGCGHVPTWDDPELVARAILSSA